MATFSLTNAEQMWMLFRYLEDRGISLEGYLDACLIPQEALVVADLKLTSKQNYDFLELVVREENLYQLGWDVGTRYGAESFGSLAQGAFLTGGRDALDSLSHEIQFHASSAHFFLLDKGETFEFCNIGSRHPDTLGYAVAEYYGIAVMIDLVRKAFSSPTFFPTSLRLRSADWAIKPPALCNVRVLFDQPYLSLDIPAALVTSSRTQGPGSRQKLPISFATKVRQLVKGHCSGEPFTLEKLSQVTGISKRSLQRELGQEDTDFRTLYLSERMNFAADQLQKTDVSIGELASSMGYQHPSHLVRAFRKVHGVTPSAFRASAKGT